MADEATPAAIELRIPCKPEFVGIARLTILGVASRMPFSYDEVEDLRLAAGEACTTAVERAAKTGRSDTQIIVRSAISGSKLSIEVEDEAGKMQELPEIVEPGVELDEQGLGALLMELLVDEFAVQPTETGTIVRMVKYAG